MKEETGPQGPNIKNIKHDYELKLQKQMTPYFGVLTGLNSVVFLVKLILEIASYDDS
jgi:hypothetical protein